MRMLALIGGNDTTKREWNSLLGFAENNFKEIIIFCQKFDNITNMESTCKEILNFIIKTKSNPPLDIPYEKRKELIKLIENRIESYELTIDLPEETDTSDKYSNDNFFVNII